MKHFLCSHLLGEMIQLDERIFQIGWNHQPVICFNLFFSNKPVNLVLLVGALGWCCVIPTGFPYALWKGLVYLGTPRFEGPKPPGPLFPPIYPLVSQVMIRIDPFLKSLGGIRGWQWNAPGSWKLQTFLLQGSFKWDPFGGFLKWWYSTTIGFPTKNDHFPILEKSNTANVWWICGGFPLKLLLMEEKKSHIQARFWDGAILPCRAHGSSTTVPSDGTLDFWTINSRALFGFVSYNDPWLDVRFSLRELPR